MKYTVFLDRDGVINKDSEGYIKIPSEFEFIPKSDEAIALLTQNSFRVIVITNQSMIGRGLSTQGSLDAIFKKMNTGIEAKGGRITDIFYCPHVPDDECACRKPKPGLIHQAKIKYAIDMGSAFMIGDSEKDILCGLAAGCAKTLLVRTGNGEKALHGLSQKQMAPDYIARDLYDAARWLINYTIS